MKYTKLQKCELLEDRWMPSSDVKIGREETRQHGYGGHVARLAEAMQKVIELREKNRPSRTMNPSSKLDFPHRPEGSSRTSTGNWFEKGFVRFMLPCVFIFPDDRVQRLVWIMICSLLLVLYRGVLLVCSRLNSKQVEVTKANQLPTWIKVSKAEEPEVIVDHKNFNIYDVYCCSADMVDRQSLIVLMGDLT